jgi:hypothetical protein
LVDPLTSVTLTVLVLRSAAVAGDGEMDPYMRFTSTPYAFNAKDAEELGGRGADEFVQLNPGATPQAVNTANSAIAINQQGHR